MKRVYWRPQKISKLALFVMGLIAVGGTMALEAFPVHKATAGQQVKLVAAQLAQRGMQAVRTARLAQGQTFDHKFDPAQSGMVGEAMSPVTSLPAHLDAKQTSVNPNFAAAVVEMLHEANVAKGQVVAVGYTGSFPAFNVAVCAALEAIGAEPIIIHSAASSQFGANAPDMMWLDMEHLLKDQGIISFRSTAATLGGFGDRARGMSEESQALLRASLDRNNVPLLPVDSLSSSITQRMDFYADASAGRPIGAYINVGGGAASIRGSEGRSAFGAGLTQKSLDTEVDLDSVATRFAAQGVPVIHMGNAIELAERFGLPVAPSEMPAVGTGTIFSASHPSRLLAAALLLTILGIVHAYVWTDLWTRWKSQLRGFLLPNSRSEEGLQVAPPQAELMV